MSSRAPISSVIAKTVTYTSHNGRPSALISLVIVAVGRPSGPPPNNRLAIAIPALNAESTAATATACHSTIAARGARAGHEARARISGTGPTRGSATRVKAGADTRLVSLSWCPGCHPVGDAWPQVQPALVSTLPLRPRRHVRRSAQARPHDPPNRLPDRARRPLDPRRARRDRG